MKEQAKSVNNDVNMTREEKNRKTKAERLEECRKRINMSKTALANKSFITRQALYNYINQKRDFDYEQAQRFGEVLGVNPDYLMNKSDNIFPNLNKSFYENTAYIASAITLLSYLSFKHDIVFHVISSTPEDNNKVKKISVNQLHNIDFDIPTCVYSEDKNGLEDKRNNAIIKSVEVDGHSYSYGKFLFVIKEIERDIDYKIQSMKDIFRSYEKNVNQIEILTQDMERNKELYNIPEVLTKE